MDGEVKRKKIQIPLNGQSEGDNHPAAVTNDEEDDEEKADTQKAKQRSCVAIDGFAGHPRSGDEEAESDEGEAHLLGCEVMHETQCKVEKGQVKRESFAWERANDACYLPAAIENAGKSFVRTEVSGL